MSLSNYQELDLKISGSKAQKLLAGLDQEAGPAPLRLSGDGDPGSFSANLTPIMSTWLSSEIAPTRTAAINSIQAEAAQFLLSGGVPGIVAEIEGDKLKRRRNERRADENLKFYRDHKSDLDALAEAEGEFLVMKAHEGGRDPLNPSKLLDLLVILGILIPEGFMNYRYFLDYIGVGIVALGSTLVIGAAFGVAAYLAGRFWKAFHFYMPPDNPAQRQKGIRMISLASMLLTVSLIAVGSVRYFGVVRQSEELLALGQVPPNAVLQTSFLLFGNLLVFALGLAITFWLHDENPRYAEKAEKYEKKQKEFDRLKKKKLLDKIDKIEEGYRQDLEKMQAKASLLLTKPGFSAIQEQIGVLNSKDNEVVALLQEYRTRLCSKMTSEKIIIKDPEQVVDVPTFATLSIELYR